MMKANFYGNLGKGRQRGCCPDTALRSSHLCNRPSFSLAGARLVPSHSLHETSSVFMDGVAKHDGAAPKFASDASKVVAKGLGLNKGFVGQKNSFTVDCSKAGECRFVGAGGDGKKGTQLQGFGHCG